MSCLDVNNDNSLEEFNNQHSKGMWFVWFYADWCGHCQHMIPHWEDLKSNNKHGVRLAKVRDDYIPRLNTSPPVQGYPTILLYKNGNVEEIYQGERSGDAFNNFLGEKVNMNTNTNSGFENNNVVELKKPKKKKASKKRKSQRKNSSNNKNKNNNNNKNKNMKKKKSQKKKKAKKSAKKLN